MVVVEFDVAGQNRPVGQGEVLGEAAPEQAGFQEPKVFDRLHPDATGALAVPFLHDELLRHVDQTTGEVTRVGGAERGVGEALASTVRRDEVLEHGQAFTEVGLDRAG